VDACRGSVDDYAMTAYEDVSPVPPVADEPAMGSGHPGLGGVEVQGALGSTDAPVSTLTSYRSAFPPIDDYAFLSDCETTCLIARNGSVEWMCVPRPDSPSIFGAVLDRSAGHFRVGPYGQSVPAARRYLPGGLIVETTWQTETGWLVVRDALVMGPWHNTDQRSRTHKRAPSDWDAEHILLRTIKCVSGTVELEMSCEPA
jgi:GH15 family glucan-1,4-alpha-glucosidase